MSAICAVLRLDGRPAEADMATPVRAALAAREPDGSRREGPFALRLVLNAPRSAAGATPLFHGVSGCPAGRWSAGKKLVKP